MTKETTHKVTEKKRSKGGERAIRYIMILGGIILAFGLVSFFFEHIFSWWFFFSVILTVLSLGGFFWGNRLQRGDGKEEEGESGKSPVFGGFVLLAGAVLMGLDVMSINKMFGAPLPGFSYIILIATAVYFTLSYFYDNRLILVVALLSLFAYLASVGGGFWAWLPFIKGGVRSHLYIAIASPIVILVGLLHDQLFGRFGERLKRYEHFDRIYYFIGFFFMNSSFWMLSLFGRDPKLWPSPPEGSREILLFTILFFMVNIGTVVFGALKKDRTFITLGAIFLTINFFTRFASVLKIEVGRSATFIIAGVVLLALGLFLEWLLKKK
ncbi:MAG: hypothetical protein JW984_09010 [Deltaproteobacteria bacterium]|uniref:DUF2157 domain-containing protein n=1 Tax=Candidatus Zymogenus saltonus TaxID=2844893 RepID=A0A9D8PNJ7_9DELT|nr:hypothetical protein [Candidatus Zymogenus saltonus]